MTQLTPEQLQTLQQASNILQTMLKTQPVLSRYDVVEAYLQTSLAPLPHEEFHILYLDRQNRLIEDHTHSTGSHSFVPVILPAVFKRALILDASALILAHNHPSGDTTPSQNDLTQTTRIIRAAKVLELVVHDHYIVTPTAVHSMRSNNDVRF